MADGTPEEVMAEVKECIEYAGKGGGYIVSTDHSIHDEIPSANVLAMIKAANEYGKYPL